MSLDMTFGENIAKSHISSGQIVINGTSQPFIFNQGSFNVPTVTEQEEGKIVSVRLSGHISNRSLVVVNTITLPLLTLEGDYDGDGLNNGLEHTLSLDPTNRDTDNNGVEDGREDYDNDGLDNLTELSLGSDLTNRDTDDDGLSDGDEYQWGSDPTLQDTDGDGISDAIEVASGSDPTDVNSRSIKPEFISAIQVTPKEVNYNIESQSEDIILTVSAQVTLEGRNYSVDVSDPGYYDLIFTSSDTNVAVTSYQGFTPVGAGITELKVSFGQFSDTSNLTVAETISLGDVVWENEDVTFDGPVFADSVTVIGNVNVNIAGDLSVVGNFDVKPVSNLHINTEKLLIGNDLFILGEEINQTVTELNLVNLNSENGHLYFDVEIPQGATNFVVKLSGGNGNADLHVTSPDIWNCTSEEPNNEELCTLHTNNWSSTHNISVLEVTPYSEVSLLVTYDIVNNTPKASTVDIMSPEDIYISGNLNMVGGEINHIGHNIDITGSLNLSDFNTIKAKNLFIHSNSTINNGGLNLGLTEEFVVDLDMLQEGLIRALPANQQTKELYPIRLKVGQKFTSKASISVNGAGYPEGVGFGFVDDYCIGAHAAAIVEYCSYGSYKKPIYAGSGGENGAGGGIVYIKANRIEVDSNSYWISIGSQYPKLSYNKNTGAGGSAFIDAHEFKVIDAENIVISHYFGGWGGEAHAVESMNTSAGYDEQIKEGKTVNASQSNGRVAIVADKFDIQVTGNGGGGGMPEDVKDALNSDNQIKTVSPEMDQINRLSTLVGISNEPARGTIYLAQKQSENNLFMIKPSNSGGGGEVLARNEKLNSIKNKNAVKSRDFEKMKPINQLIQQELASSNWSVFDSLEPDSINILSVGKHQVNDIILIEENLWSITVNDDPWANKVKALGRELDGTQIRLTNDLGDTIEAQIISNTINSLVVKSSDDLSNMATGVIQGLHSFKKLELSYATVSFGKDIVEVSDGHYNRTKLWAGYIDPMTITSIIESGNIYKVEIYVDQELVFDDISFRANYSSLAAKSIQFNNTMTFEHRFNISANSIDFKQDVNVNTPVVFNTFEELNVAGNLVISNASINSIGQINVDGDVTVKSRLNIGYPGSNSSEIRPNKFEIKGKLLINEEAGIYSIQGDKTVRIEGESENIFAGSHVTSAFSTAFDSIKPTSFGNYKSPLSSGKSALYHKGCDQIDKCNTNSSFRFSGGGVLNIKAQIIENNGVISVSPKSNNISEQVIAAGAGSILLEADTILGNGSMDAVGFSGTYNKVDTLGSSGRIALISENYDYTGDIITGKNYNGLSNTGTVFIKDKNMIYGRLELKTDANYDGNITLSNWIKLPEIGKHAITQVIPLENQSWRISVANANWQDNKGFNIKGEYVDLDLQNETNQFYEILDFDENSITISSSEDLDYLNQASFELIGVHIFDSIYLSDNSKLDIGIDKLIILDRANSYLGDNIFLKALIDNPETLSWLTENNVSLYQKEIIIPNDLGLNYRETKIISADKIKVFGSINLSNSANLILHSNSNLEVEGDFILGQSSKVTGDLEGADIEIFGDLILEYGSNLRFKKQVNSFIVHGEVKLNTSGAKLELVSHDVEFKNSLNVGANSDVELKVLGDLTIDKDFILSYSNDYSLIQVKGEWLIKNNMLLEQSAHLKTFSLGGINIGNNLNTSKYSRLALSSPQYDQLKQLLININNTVQMDEDSSITATAAGFTFKNFPGSQKYSCHAGVVRSRYNNLDFKDCQYGFYGKAQFAGLAGDTWNLDYRIQIAGGGVIVINTKDMILNGKISADGGVKNSQGGGSGGSIHIQSDKLTGSGSISAKGRSGGPYDSQGGGGRISIYTNDHTEYTGTTTTASTDYVRYSSYESGAGTVYIADDIGKQGHFKIDNGISNSHMLHTDSGTVIRNAGKGVIECVTDLNENKWLIQPEGYCDSTNTLGSWNDSLEKPKHSLIGRSIDLDINDETNEILTIVSNTRNSLVVESRKDLSYLVGKTYQGIHQFKSIELLNRASVDFGNNRVEVTDVDNSKVMGNIQLKLGDANPVFKAYLEQTSADITWLEQ